MGEEQKSSSLIEKIKSVGKAIVLPLIGLALVARFIYSIFFKKDTLKEALIADQDKASKATEAAVRGEASGRAADEIGAKADNVQEDPEWESKRKKF
jgi:hypothetical protein